MGEMRPFDYRGLKLAFCGWIVAMAGVVLALFLHVGWPAYLFIGLGGTMLLSGLIMHVHEFVRQDREWRMHRKPAQGSTKADPLG
jgi:hypothetical protein